MGKKRELPEWAQSIIGQSLVNVTSKETAEEVKADLEGTALGVNNWMLKIAFDLVDKKIAAFKLE